MLDGSATSVVGVQVILGRSNHERAQSALDDVYVVTNTPVRSASHVSVDVVAVIVGCEVGDRPGDVDGAAGRSVENIVALVDDSIGPVVVGRRNNATQGQGSRGGCDLVTAAIPWEVGLDVARPRTGTTAGEVRWRASVGPLVELQHFVAHCFADNGKLPRATYACLRSGCAIGRTECAATREGQHRLRPLNRKRTAERIGPG